MVKTNPKVALCFSGLVGNLDKYGSGEKIDINLPFEYNKKHILEKNDVDIFIHTWSTEEKDALINLYNPKDYIIEEQIDFGQNSTRNNAIHSKCYSVMKSVELKKKYEKENNFKYDFVMIFRFDSVFLVDLNFSEFDNNYFWCGANNENSTEHIDDQWFFSNSKNIDTISNLYNDISNIEAVSRTNSPHRYWKIYLQKTGLDKICKYKFDMNNTKFADYCIFRFMESENV